MGLTSHPVEWVEVLIVVVERGEGLWVTEAPVGPLAFGITFSRSRQVIILPWVESPIYG